jgi:hypothetical protein
MPHLPYLADRAELTDASDLITMFGSDARTEAAARADRSRDLGNYLHFCRWRPLKRYSNPLSLRRLAG